MLDPEKKKIIIDYLQAYNPAKIGIFGSYARVDRPVMMTTFRRFCLTSLID